jgi:hypothetical protein
MGETRAVDRLQQPAPRHGGRVRPVHTPHRRLEEYFARSGIGRVDPRLVCEIEKGRIASGGYAESDIANLVTGWGYEWSLVVEERVLEPLKSTRDLFRSNYMARPR